MITVFIFGICGVYAGLLAWLVVDYWLAPEMPIENWEDEDAQRNSEWAELIRLEGKEL